MIVISVSACLTRPENKVWVPLKQMRWGKVTPGLVWGIRKVNPSQASSLIREPKQRAISSKSFQSPLTLMSLQSAAPPPAPLLILVHGLLFWQALPEYSLSNYRTLSCQDCLMFHSQKREGAEGTEVWFSRNWTLWWWTVKEVWSGKQVFVSPKGQMNLQSSGINPRFTDNPRGSVTPLLFCLLCKRRVL